MNDECPDCGEELEIKENRDGEEFWGCSGFPECRYTESIEEEEVEGWDRNSVKYR